MKGLPPLSAHAGLATGRAALRLQRLRAERRVAGRASAVLGPPLKTSPYGKELVSRHWLEGRYAGQLGRKVAWVTSGAPVELLKALDFFVIYPENHGAICGTARLAESLMTEAEAAGYSRDLCSYARTDLGCLLSGRTPVGRIPRPDLLLACTNICQTVLYWYRTLADRFGVPLLLIDTPFVYYDQAPAHAVEYVRRQLEASIPLVERVSGKRLRPDRLRQVAALAKTASELWMEVLQRNRLRPAPISAIEQFIQMAPIVELRGDPETVDYYAAVLAELDERISHGVGAIVQERKRLLWDNLPVWYRLRDLAELLGRSGAVLVASTYTNAWGELAPLIDPEAPLDSAARTYLVPILNRSTGSKLATMGRMIADYQLDGVILHSDRSCKPYSIGQIDQRERLAREYGRPALLLEADHNDPRCYAEAPTANRLAAFLELLG